MSDNGARIIELLTQQTKLLFEQNALLRELINLTTRGGAREPGMTSGVTQTPPASADVLDRKYGDPTVKFDPGKWAGPSMKGRKYSECPADFLDLLANSLDFFAKKNEENNVLLNNGKPKAKYEREDAGKARGWAQRLRDKPYQEPTPPDWAEPVDAPDDIPF
jgi:hypothetical protein